MIANHNSYKANRLEIDTEKDISKEIEKQNMKLIKQVDRNYEIEIKDEDDAYTLMKNLVNNNYKINKFELKRPSLNDIFIEKVGQ